MSTLRLMLVRHGQTEANLRNALDSKPPGAPLTDEGHAQAAVLAERLAGMPVTGVYASAATRAQQTARPVADVHGLDVVVLDDVHEVLAGDLEGRTDPEAIGEFAQVFHQWVTGSMDVRMPGAQTGHEVRERYLRAIDRIRETHKDGLVVMVSHGGVIRLAAQWLVPDVTTRLTDLGMLVNTGHVLLEADGEGWRCLEWTGLAL